MKKHGFTNLQLPDPLALAILLTLITMVLAFFLGEHISVGFAGVIDVLNAWQKGFWELLAFSMQMTLILLLGYMLALTPFFDKLSSALLKHIHSNAQAVLAVVFSALILGFLNWGLALVFGSVFVRKIGDYSQKQQMKINYPLLGASAYVCMMVWHGGLSGSAPLVVAEKDHFLFAQIGQINLSDTLFSAMNLLAWSVLLAGIPLLAWWMLKRDNWRLEVAKIPVDKSLDAESSVKSKAGMLHAFGLLMLVATVISVYFGKQLTIGLNDINMVLFALVLLFSGSIRALQVIAAKAVGSTIGIVIQFPLYAGIMGIMKYSGLLVVISAWFIRISSEDTFAIYTLFSAGLVNLFVPSGGGQWAVQGPVIVEAAQALGVPVAKAIMALAYGDQLTNMLQPFWALPLLGITGLKAGELMRYTIRFLLLGLLIFGLVLLIF